MAAVGLPWRTMSDSASRSRNHYIVGESASPALGDLISREKTERVNILPRRRSRDRPRGCRMRWGGFRRGYLYSGANNRSASPSTASGAGSISPWNAGSRCNTGST